VANFKIISTSPNTIQLPVVCYCKETLAIAILAGWSICPIVNKGTFKLHVVAVIGKSEVFVRETSCYCNVCLEGGICDEWRKEWLGNHTTPCGLLL
jgi:hypothetical protein